jgi:hypothetical protein
MNLKEILFNETTIKNFQISENTSIVLKSLTTKDKEEINQEVFFKFPNCTDVIINLAASRIPILCKSMVSINGIPVQSLDDVQIYLKENKESKVEDAIRNILESFDDELITFYFYLYTEVVAENKAKKDKYRNFYQARKDATTGS